MKRLSAAANAGLILSLMIALYVGFRLPNLWSVNYYIPSVFDGVNPARNTAVPLKLKSVEQRANDTLWIRYTVVRS